MILFWPLTTSMLIRKRPTTTIKLSSKRQYPLLPLPPKHTTNRPDQLAMWLYSVAWIRRIGARYTRVSICCAIQLRSSIQLIWRIWPLTSVWLLSHWRIRTGTITQSIKIVCTRKTCKRMMIQSAGAFIWIRTLTTSGIRNEVNSRTTKKWLDTQIYLAQLPRGMPNAAPVLHHAWIADKVKVALKLIVNVCCRWTP